MSHSAPIQPRLPGKELLVLPKVSVAKLDQRGNELQSRFKTYLTVLNLGFLSSKKGSSLFSLESRVEASVVCVEHNMLGGVRSSPLPGCKTLSTSGSQSSYLCHGD